MTREKAIKNLNALYPLTCKMVDGRYKGGFKDTESPVGQTISTAIRSLEAWDKLREEIQTEDPHCCKYTDEYGMVIPLDCLISAIDSYLQEVEE